ncbi:transcriptional regulator with XRE-family HTH domain [Dyadobacter sp. BE34]|uniref:Transcriptional regulator with XRE-family HTH domain n=1 Tax=Dyadobacter fermentans TaxID=94254 RepID=A0ABU1QXA8_9BACT|nr:MULTISPECIES: helix-turn-helix domain-containing protein [Dyadobacter]MDR6805637.1 transcriptional regulator with XRE-family HTH domain [Dyadobacter fermentans]MDR7042603.1 transcriptional regulator with XRE-family HTH domain [Dyadobacter sp. BE242]MDR7196915.1 transcriptional regulator with XRE-family HTH domain [Dyadobacter sp. BE34]MDR7215650.1 transcriptional regulator with XRE-family HTH domain [Dyadobacter sp. BE31]MDR7263186.1 transcriptional regulator with XRE-family HTH domain [Dya
MSIVSNNIKYLRRLNGLTQEQFARKISIKRSLLGAYEEARANPNLTNLKNMAAAFGVSVDNLLKNDLRKLRETPEMSLPLTTSRQMTVSHSGTMPQPTPTRTPGYTEPQPLSKIIETYQQPEQPLRQVSRQINLKPISGETPQPDVARPNVAQPNAVRPNAAQQEVFHQPAYQQPASHSPATMQPQPAPQPGAGLPTFNNQYQTPQFNAAVEQPAQHFPTIQWVARNKQAEYIAHFQNPGYLNSLPLFQLPNLPSGYYRAFESGEDFTYPGSILVGTFIRNWYDIKDGMQYVFLLRNHGLIYRNVFNQVKTAGVLLLTSDNAEIAELEVPLQDVLEVWEVKAFVSAQMPVPQPSLERVAQLVDELQMELSQYRQ